MKAVRCVESGSRLFPQGPVLFARTLQISHCPATAQGCKLVQSTADVQLPSMPFKNIFSLNSILSLTDLAIDVGKCQCDPSPSLEDMQVKYSSLTTRAGSLPELPRPRPSIFHPITTSRSRCHGIYVHTCWQHILKGYLDPDPARSNPRSRSPSLVSPPKSSLLRLNVIKCMSENDFAGGSM